MDFITKHNVDCFDGIKFQIFRLQFNLNQFLVKNSQHEVECKTVFCEWFEKEDIDMGHWIRWNMDIEYRIRIWVWNTG